jgi:putative spermidine/putrescine transport system substrate-binding protein
VPKGSPNREAPMRFIAEAVSAEGQAELARQTGLSPITPAALDLLEPELRAVLPHSQTASQIKTDLAYWAANRDMISDRWYAWQAE